MSWFFFALFWLWNDVFLQFNSLQVFFPSLLWPACSFKLTPSQEKQQQWQQEKKQTYILHFCNIPTLGLIDHKKSFRRSIHHRKSLLSLHRLRKLVSEFLLPVLVVWYNIPPLEKYLEKVETAEIYVSPVTTAVFPTLCNGITALFPVFLSNQSRFSCPPLSIRAVKWCPLVRGKDSVLRLIRDYSSVTIETISL